MEKGFKEGLGKIPNEVTTPLEKEKNPDEVLDDADLIINKLEGLQSEGSEEMQVRLLPQVKKLITELQEVQKESDKNSAYDKEGTRIALTRLIAERDRIKAMIN